MRYGVTFNQNGQVLPAGLHIPQNFALLPYVPHPLQITGHVPLFGTLSQPLVQAGQGQSRSVLFPTR